MRNNRIVLVIVLSFASLADAQVAPPPQRVAPAPAAVGQAPAGGEVLPSLEQLKQQLAEGKHQEVLRSVAKLLALKGDRAHGYDRYELFCLRGEAALRGKANPMAAEAFAQAAKATDDADKQTVARANELLIRRSKPVGYVPRTAAAAPAPGPGAAGAADAAARPRGNQPIPIVEPETRKQAFAALFNDELAAVEPKVRAATKATGLAPVIDAIKLLGDLRAIEYAAEGSAGRTKALGADLGAHAHQLISSALGPMSGRVEECWQSASRQRVTRDLRTGAEYKAYGLWGLTSTEQNALKEVIATCEKIQPVASELAAVTDRPELIAAAQEAQKLHARATEVLTYDYNNEGRYNKDPKKPARP